MTDDRALNQAAMELLAEKLMDSCDRCLDGGPGPDIKEFYKLTSVSYDPEKTEAVVTMTNNTLRVEGSFVMEFVARTLAELRHIRADKIIEKNVPIGTCISCGLGIYGVENVLETRHGMYHYGDKYTCVEGR